MNERYYSFNIYLRKIFGERVQRISLNAGFACPNLDGAKSRRGCVYCNNKGFSRFAETGLDLRQQIADSIEFYTKRLGVKKFIAYFQAFSNTYADCRTLKESYDLIKEFPQVCGLFISTRPDCVDEEKIKLIAGYARDYLVWIEYGLQTTQNPVLTSINRNHSYEDFLAALALTRKYGINVGAHLIFGLPGSSDQQIAEDTERIANLDIQGVKFHVLHVLRQTELESQYQKGSLKLLDQAAYVKIVCDFLERIPPKWVILRLVSDADRDYLVAPDWINNKPAVIEEIRKELARRETFQGSYYEGNCS
ncbi:MAG: TIGR01212 family radical SAM protein [Candidatus Omnitrophica bacterium]|nr:TIGR01212 family radical SAM protein [Candidatus Omnitrophota bacterium]MBU2043939.1 TIGR01212 family radical SAM protein [Candidatus Omnitrophota bacterium]MBU2265840.1 TIGR01212 family radical SAM protein [Candidatus Omnitrophota bacterium]MBU2474144.1 TIGR01212 family radical SAM protein [Candidatus Omnitrophota bacterium]